MKKKTVIHILILSAAVLLRIAFFDYETLDYENFLSQWVRFFRDNGGFAALRYSVGNYNIPYLYFLAAFSYLPVSPLYLIKALSCVFDFLLAFFSMKLVRKCGASEDRSLFCFYAVLFLPTVVVNGSLWAQCDAIYVALGVAGLYYALDDRPILSMLFMALSFGYKLQAVFILPVCILLLIMKKYKIWHFALFPLFYLVQILPACLLGRPLLSALTLYTDQLGTVGSAPNYNAPAFNALTHGSGSIAAAFIAMVMLFCIAYILRNRLDNRAFLVLAVLMVTLIPYLLPHMHDRYFFAADVLSVALACSMTGIRFGSVLFTALCQQFASFICYLAYLKTYYIPLGRIYLTNDRGAVAVLIALLIYAVTLAFETRLIEDK